MLIRVLETELRLTNCSTRVPFRFGIATLTAAPLCVARVLMETQDGRRVEGYSSDLLVPKWFSKDPKKSPGDDVIDLIQSANQAAAAYEGPPATVFDLWHRVDCKRVESVPEDAPDRLVRGFGVALWERAIMDAACRATGISFFQAIKTDLFGFAPGRVHPQLRDWGPADALPDAPLESVFVRHTVGLLDPLRASDISPADRVDDGLPQSLDEDIQRYGLRYFKLKISGDRAADLERLLEIGRVLEVHCDGSAKFTLDGNEQYESLADLAALLHDLAEDEQGRSLLAGLLYIEQPLSRGISFDSARNAAMADVTAFAPVIIDEADTGLSAFPRAATLGYAGVSVKNCKGVFRALLNRGLCDVSGGRLFQSAEDLTNLPAIALQQDLATIAALGLTHVERNGQHYFRGLDHLPGQEACDALHAHPDLYVDHGDGIALNIKYGRLSLASLRGPGYGYAMPVQFDARMPAEQWAGFEGES